VSVELVHGLKINLKGKHHCQLSAGVFSAIWKESLVIPSFKRSDKRDVSCYRGITILSAIPKTFEKMVCDILTPIARSVISDTQHGFVKGRLTASNSVQFTNDVINEIENGWQAEIIFDNFFFFFCWRRFYLTGRTQHIQLRDYLSKSIQCHSEVT
jgi:hypothetical protein